MKYTKKHFSIIIALALIANLTFTALPATVSAGATTYADKTVTIAQSMDVTGPASVESTIQSAIDSLGAAGGTVTVSGSKTNADEPMELMIPAKVKVVWKATYKGSTYPLSSALITVIGKGTSPSEAYLNSGTFEIAAGEIAALADDRPAISCGNAVTIKVTGGTVSSAGVGILATDPGSGSSNSNNITVSGGEVSASGDESLAIKVDKRNHGNITISGGIVKAAGTRSIAITGFGDGDVRVTVSGGQVVAEGNQCIGIRTVEARSTIVTGGEIKISSGSSAIGILSEGYGKISVSQKGKINISCNSSYGIDTTGANKGNVVMSGGSINMTGTNSIAIAGGAGTFAVSGGEITTATGGTSLYMENFGVAAYRTGICKDTDCIVDSGNGIIVQVSPLLIPMSYDQKVTGITWQKGSGSYYWDLVSAKPTITFNPPGGSQKTMEWGTYQPPKTSISKVTPGKKQMKVTWKKLPAAERIANYQLRYRIKGTTKWKTKTYADSKSSATIKSLKKGKAYQIQARSCLVIDISGIGKSNYYSPWSTTKTSKKIK